MNDATLEFEFYPNEKLDTYHNVDLRFSVPTDMTLEELHTLCKRFALACGYAEASVEQVFGED